MYLLEATFIVVSVALLFGINTMLLSRRACAALLITGISVVVLALLIGQARIHMVPVLLVFVVSSFFLLKRGRGHIALRSAGALPSPGL